MSPSSSSSSSLRRIDLSIDSPTVFWSRRNPLSSPSPKKSWLPLSSPVPSDPAGATAQGEEPSPKRPRGTLTKVSAAGDNYLDGEQGGAGGEDQHPSEGKGLMRSMDPFSESIAGPSKPRRLIATKALNEVEDVSDSQWDQAVLSSARRRRGIPNLADDADADNAPSSPSYVERSDTPPLSSVRTPPMGSPSHGAYYDVFDDPRNWPDSPTLPTMDGVMLVTEDYDERHAVSVGKRSATPPQISRASFNLEEKDGFGRRIRPDSVAEGGGSSQKISYQPSTLIANPDQDDGRDPGGVEPGADSSTLDADVAEPQARLDHHQHEASLADLFADEPSSNSKSPTPPPRLRRSSRSSRSSPKASSSPFAEVLDLTTSHAEDPNDPDRNNDITKNDNEEDEYDFDDLHFPDVDFDTDFGNTPGPSTTPTRTSRAVSQYAPPQVYASPVNPPPVVHPIMLISDLPPDVQEFYNNHWRRGADKKRKVVASAEWSDEEEVATTKKRAPAKRGSAFRGTWFRNRGARGGGRARGGRGRVRR